VKTIPLDSAITINSCPNSPVLWVSTHDSKIQLINKNSLEITKTISLENQAKITKITCLQNGNAILLKDQHNKPIIYSSKTFKQLY